MKKFWILCSCLFCIAQAQAEKQINLDDLQKQILPILQNVDTQKLLESFQQVQSQPKSSTKNNKQNLELEILDLSEPEEGDLCDVNDPEHCDKEKTMKFNELKSQEQELLMAAEKAMQNSYSPYSGFRVGAAVLTEDGKIIVGTNYENAAYGSTVCAERVAIMSANAQGYRKIKKIAIIGAGKEPAGIVTPCGACRQVINESSDLSSQVIELIMSNTNKDKIVIKTIKELLPMDFGPKSLS
jgi:cytidine deaminase